MSIRIYITEWNCNPVKIGEVGTDYIMSQKNHNSVQKRSTKHFVNYIVQDVINIQKRHAISFLIITFLVKLIKTVNLDQVFFTHSHLIF